MGKSLTRKAILFVFVFAEDHKTPINGKFNGKSALNYFSACALNFRRVIINTYTANSIKAVPVGQDSELQNLDL